MSRFVFRLPDIGEGIAEAEIVAWHVKLGSRVEEDAPLADMMTDKATVEMESPVSGIIVELAGEEGAVVAIGAPLVVIETDGASDDTGSEAGSVPEPPSAGQPVEADRPEPRSLRAPDAPLPPPEVPLPPPESPVTGAPIAPDRPRPKVLAAPAVRARAAELGVDLALVRPTIDGRVRHADLDAFVAYSAGGFGASGTRRPDELVKVIGLRRRIADNMAAAKRNIPHFSYVERYDVTALESLRAQLNGARGERPKLTMLPFLITAICRLIPKYPMLNAHFDDQAGTVLRYGAIHIGMAAQSPAGLMVPVIRDAQDRNLWQLAREIARLAQAVRDGSIKSPELSGSTITVTSLGPMGGMVTTPVINRPEVAIIGPNSIVEQPMFARDPSGIERLETRKLMNISMSCDHRVVDGWDVASFAQDLKALIETPATLLMPEQL
ncbi:MAG: dihydrolipoamide acetyltransferase family protein [Novosphingobium sp.]